jgi:DNA-binding CsgD family transcriptional regulator
VSTSDRGAPRREAPPKVAPALEAPAGLTASRFDVGGDEYVLLEWPAATIIAPACLTLAERKVMELLLGGLSNAAIATARGSSPRTVANQVASIFQKLGVGSRAELFARLAAGSGGDRT